MSWEKRTLGDLCQIEKGKIGIQKATSGEFPLVVTSEERLSHNEYHFEGNAVVIPLVSSTGHGHRSLKRIHFQSGKFAVGNILCAVIPNDENILRADYLYRFLDLNREKELVGRMRGMANVTLPMKEIAQIEIPVPPIDVQIEFVQHYSNLEGISNELGGELTHQLDLVKQLRKSMLREAMQGDLVSQNENDETASVLLEKIKAEKELLVKEKKIKKQNPLPPIKEEKIPFEIPENWVWCRLGEISNHITDGEHQTPPRIKEGRMLLSAKNVRDGFFDFDNVEFISEEHFQKSMNRCKPALNDVLIVSVGATIGRSAILKEEKEFALVRSVALIKPQEKSMSGFIKYVLDSPLLQNDISTRSWGTAQPCLYLNQIKELSFPLPPLSEQQRIVAKLDELMAYCDELEVSIKESQQQNELLLQQVLREALEPEEKEVVG